MSTTKGRQRRTVLLVLFAPFGLVIAGAALAIELVSVGLSSKHRAPHD
jgi:hypothetical protein